MVLAEQFKVTMSTYLGLEGKKIRCLDREKKTDLGEFYRRRSIIV